MIDLRLGIDLSIYLIKRLVSAEVIGCHFPFALHMSYPSASFLSEYSAVNKSTTVVGAPSSVIAFAVFSSVFVVGMFLIPYKDTACFDTPHFLGDKRNCQPSAFRIFTHLHTLLTSAAFNVSVLDEVKHFRYNILIYFIDIVAKHGLHDIPWRLYLYNTTIYRCCQAFSQKNIDFPWFIVYNITNRLLRRNPNGFRALEAVKKRAKNDLQ